MTRRGWKTKREGIEGKRCKHDRKLMEIKREELEVGIKIHQHKEKTRKKSEAGDQEGLALN